MYSELIVDPNHYEKTPGPKFQNTQGSTVSVKRKKDDEKFFMRELTAATITGEFQKKLLFRQIETLSKINNPCCVRLHGFTLPTEDNPPQIYFTFCENGLLSAALVKARRNPLPWWNATRKTITLIGIAEGMRCLHKLHIIHRNLKPDVILYNDKYEPLISEFGLAKMAEADNMVEMSGKFGEPSYMAPEVINLEPGKPLTEKIDVFSYGMIMYYIITGTMPFATIIKNPMKIYNAIVNGDRPDPSGVPDEWKEIMVSCWDEEPMNRPTFEQIVGKILSENLMLPESDEEEVQAYIEKCVQMNNKIGNEFKPLEDAAESGDTTAQVLLGYKYYFGDGIERNDAKAIEYFKKAADLGDPSGLIAYGRLNRDGGRSTAAELEKSRKYAHTLFDKASKSCVQAYNSLGVNHLYGFGEPYDPKKSLAEFQKSAEGNCPNGQYNLARSYFHGYGGKQDFAEATRLYELAAKAGEPCAMIDLAINAKLGIGTAPNPSLAEKWLESAVECGSVYELTSIDQ